MTKSSELLTNQSNVKLVLFLMMNKLKHSKMVCSPVFEIDFIRKFKLDSNMWTGRSTEKCPRRRLAGIFRSSLYVKVKMTMNQVKHFKIETIRTMCTTSRWIYWNLRQMWVIWSCSCFWWWTSSSTQSWFAVQSLAFDFVRKSEVCLKKKNCLIVCYHNTITSIAKQDKKHMTSMTMTNTPTTSIASQCKPAV